MFPLRRHKSVIAQPVKLPSALFKQDERAKPSATISSLNFLINNIVFKTLGMAMGSLIN